MPLCILFVSLLIIHWLLKLISFTETILVGVMSINTNNKKKLKKTPLQELDEQVKEQRKVFEKLKKKISGNETN
jgi:hypothetical protein